MININIKNHNISYNNNDYYKIIMCIFPIVYPEDLNNLVCNEEVINMSNNDKTIFFRLKWF